MNRLFALGGQRIEASATVLPMNIQGWSPFRLTGLISLQSKELSRVFSSTTVRTHQFFAIQSSLRSNFHIHTWLLEETTALTLWTFVGKWCLCFLTQRFVVSFLPRSKCLLMSWLRSVIAFFPRSKCLLMSWLQSPSAVILEPQI